MLPAAAPLPQMMELVDLIGLRTAHVGRPGVSGLSVEQRKRLTLAVELVANPSIVFMVGRHGLPAEATPAGCAMQQNLLMGSAGLGSSTHEAVLCAMWQLETWLLPLLCRMSPRLAWMPVLPPS